MAILTVRAYGFTAADREWQRDFPSYDAAVAWAAAAGASITEAYPLGTVAPRDRRAELADTVTALDQQFFAIRGRR